MNIEPLIIPPEAAINAIGKGIVAINHEGRIGVFNKSAEAIFKVTAEKALSASVVKILPDTGLQMLQCLKTGKKLNDLQCKVGRTPLSGVINPIIEEGQATGAVGIFDAGAPTDQPSLQQQTQALRRINRQLDAVFESSHDGLFITDGDGNILKCNHSSEGLIGHKQEDIIGKNVQDLVTLGYIDKSVTHEVLRKKTSLTILQKLRNGKSIIVTGTPAFNESGGIEFVVTNERDITALNQMRQQLREYRELAYRQSKGVDGIVAVGPATKDIVANDSKTRKVFQTAEIVAGFDTTILIQGETGVGKGRMAKFIHDASPRKKGPFVQINCGAIPEPLIESELFGYRKGAFTGASETGKAGLFQMANKGTLVLDEVSEIPLSVQVKFLKAIEEMEIMAVGDTRPRKINVRIIASTNVNLKKKVSEGTFREDLFFRLNVVPIRIPPLRERPDDVLPMITNCLERFNSQYQCNKKLSAAARDKLIAYSYPGNVRELENIIERIMILCPHDEISLRELPGYVVQDDLDGNFHDPGKGTLSLKEAVARYEKKLILSAIEKQGSKAAAARALGVDPSTIVRKSLKFKSDPPSAIMHDVNRGRG